MLASVCSYLMKTETKMDIWPSWCVFLFKKSKKGFCFSHFQCELDIHCPFLVRLEQIESSQQSSSPKNSKAVTDTQRNVGLIEVHVQSYLHFTDFKNSRQQTWDANTVALIFFSSKFVFLSSSSFRFVLVGHFEEHNLDTNVVHLLT